MLQIKPFVALKPFDGYSLFEMSGVSVSNYFQFQRVFPGKVEIFCWHQRILEELALFIHLHVHTEYSLSDGAARIRASVDKAAELGHAGCYTLRSRSNVRSN